MEKTVNERIVKKIRKALALADNNTSEQESQTAMLMAQKLMAKHNISMGEIDADQEQGKEGATEGFGTDYTRLQWWQRQLASLIADNFRVYFLINKTYGKKRVVFFGKESDVEIAVQVYKFAEQSIKHLAKQYVKNVGINGDRSLTNAIKNDYIVGFLKGMSDKFKEQVASEELSLVLVKDDDVVEAFNNMNLKTERTRSSARRTGDSDAINSGYKDGKSLDANKKRIG